MRASYPSDISYEQFAKILPILATARKKTRPQTVDLHEVFCGVAYVLKSGCQWRMIPSDFPKWRTCYDYFQKWSEKRENEKGEKIDSILEECLKKISWRGETKQWSERKNQLHNR
jgi:transposase